MFWQRVNQMLRMLKQQHESDTAKGYSLTLTSPQWTIYIEAVPNKHHENQNNNTTPRQKIVEKQNEKHKGMKN